MRVEEGKHTEEGNKTCKNNIEEDQEEERYRERYISERIQEEDSERNQKEDTERNQEEERTGAKGKNKQKVTEGTQR
jgi:hypothetical protein